jgi:CHASE3 domain sensor protein
VPGLLDVRHSLERTIALWFLLVAAISIGLGVVTFRGVNETAVDEKWVGHTQEVLLRMERTFSLVKDAESGTRGFVMTFEPRFLEACLRALPLIELG